MSNPPIRVHLRSDLLVRRATITDVAWLCWLHARNSEALGFIPRRGIEEAVESGRVLMALLNAQPAAYILHGVVRPGRDVRIFQHCVQYDVRLQWIGLTLLEELECELRTKSTRCIQVKIRDQHEAIGFWLRAGYEPTRIEPGGMKRKKPIVVCIRSLAWHDHLHSQYPPSVQ